VRDQLERIVFTMPTMDANAAVRCCCSRTEQYSSGREDEKHANAFFVKRSSAAEHPASRAVENRIDASWREREHSFDQSIAMEHRLYAEGLEILLVREGRASDHARAERHRNLRGQRSDTATRTVDQQRFTLRQPDMPHHRLVRGETARGRLAGPYAVES
jgi:uncharacterized protein (UPF0248 family)